MNPKTKGRDICWMHLDALVKCGSDEWTYKYFEGRTSIRQVRRKERRDRTVMGVGKTKLGDGRRGTSACTARQWRRQIYVRDT